MVQAAATQRSPEWMSALDAAGGDVDVAWSLLTEQYLQNLGQSANPGYEPSGVPGKPFGAMGNDPRAMSMPQSQEPRGGAMDFLGQVANPLSGMIGLGGLLQAYVQQHPEVAQGIQDAMSNLATMPIGGNPLAGPRLLEGYQQYVTEPNRQYEAEGRALAEKYGLDTSMGTGMNLGARYPNMAPKWLPPEVEAEIQQHAMNDPLLWGIMGSTAPLTSRIGPGAMGRYAKAAAKHGEQLIDPVTGEIFMFDSAYGWIDQHGNPLLGEAPTAAEMVKSGLDTRIPPNEFRDPTFEQGFAPEDLAQTRANRRGREPKKAVDYPDVPKTDPIQSGVDALIRGGMKRDKAVITAALQDLAIDMGYTGDDIVRFASDLNNQARMKNLLATELHSEGIARQLAEEGVLRPEQFGVETVDDLTTELLQLQGVRFDETGAQISKPDLAASYELLGYKNVPDAMVNLLRKRVYPEVTGKRPGGQPYPGIDESWSFWEHPPVEPSVMQETAGHVWPQENFPWSSGGFREPGTPLSISERMGDITEKINPYVESGARALQHAGRAVREMMPESTSRMFSGKPGQLATAMSDRWWMWPATVGGLGWLGHKAYDITQDLTPSSYSRPIPAPNYERMGNPDIMREFLDENALWQYGVPERPERLRTPGGIARLDYGQKPAELYGDMPEISGIDQRLIEGLSEPRADELRLNAWARDQGDPTAMGADFADYVGQSGYTRPMPQDWSIQRLQPYIQPEDWQDYRWANQEATETRDQGGIRERITDKHGWVPDARTWIEMILRMQPR
jgi:hypothetical protein